MSVHARCSSLVDFAQREEALALTHCNSLTLPGSCVDTTTGCDASREALKRCGNRLRASKRCMSVHARSRPVAAYRINPEGGGHWE